MGGLWRKWWFRLVLGIVATPVIVTIAGKMGEIVSLIGSPDFAAQVHDQLTLFPKQPMLIAIVELAFVLPLWIGVEVSNARRKLPLPPLITALCIGLLSFCFVLGLECVLRTDFGGGGTDIAPFGIDAGIVYLGSSAVTIAIVQPLIRGWLKRQRRQQNVSSLF